MLLDKLPKVLPEARLSAAQLVSKAMCTTNSNYGGVVYILSCLDTPYIKIGFTKGNPKTRCADIAKGCSLPVEIRVIIPGGRELEQVLHFIFAEYRHKDEWFEMRDALKEFCQWAAAENFRPNM